MSKQESFGGGTAASSGGVNDRICCYCGACESLNAEGKWRDGFPHCFLYPMEWYEPRNAPVQS